MAFRIIFHTSDDDSFKDKDTYRSYDEAEEVVEDMLTKRCFIGNSDVEIIGAEIKRE